jgi:probable rRNA maturation factor
MHVTVTNRQRIIPIDLAKVKTMAAKVADALCINLDSEPSKLLSARQVKDIQKRAEVSLVFVSNTAIRKLNNTWRNKDVPTDVLSFPLNEAAPPGGMPWELGEIFISTEKALEQSKTFGHTLDRELAFLTVHGLLHLLGFDHETPEEEKVMFARQSKILIKAGFPRS